MKTLIHDILVRRWATLGAMFAVQTIREAVDIEKILLDTARNTQTNSRIFQLACTWLVLHGDYVATHRLVRMILDDLEKQHRPTLGLLLETAQSHRCDLHLGKAIEACAGAIDALPLFNIDRRNSFFARLAEQNASVLSRKWGRWCEEVVLKPNAIRPASWIFEHNPHLQLRSLYAGDICRSIIAESVAQGGVVSYGSELDVCRAFVASRGGVRSAIRKLELAGIVQRNTGTTGLTVCVKMSKTTMDAITTGLTI